MGRTKARTTLQAEFSAEGLRRLAEELRQYEHRLERANDTFVRRLAEAGFHIATQQIVKAFPSLDSDKPIGSLDIVTDSSGEISSCTLVFSSEQALFIEFGAGIHYNKGRKNPLEGQFGYGVGTYPNQKHAFNDKGWSYEGRDGRWHHSKGTMATMPMYTASVSMREQIISIAKEVYQGVI